MVIGGDTTRSAFEGQIIPHFDCLNIRVRLCMCVCVLGIGDFSCFGVGKVRWNTNNMWN